MSRRGVVGLLLEQARDRGDCSTAQLALLSGQSDRAVRHALVEPESRSEQLLRLHAKAATPHERLCLVQDFADHIGADVVLLPGKTAAVLGRAVDAIGDLQAALPARKAA